MLQGETPACRGHIQGKCPKLQTLQTHAVTADLRVQFCCGRGCGSSARIHGLALTENYRIRVPLTEPERCPAAEMYRSLANASAQWSCCQCHQLPM